MKICATEAAAAGKARAEERYELPPLSPRIRANTKDRIGWFARVETQAENKFFTGKSRAEAIARAEAYLTIFDIPTRERTRELI